MGHQRAEDLHLRRPPRQPPLHGRAHRHRGAEAPRRLRLRLRLPHGLARHHGAPALDHRRRAHQRDLLRGCTDPRRLARRRGEPRLVHDHGRARPRACYDRPLRPYPTRPRPDGRGRSRGPYRAARGPDRADQARLAADLTPRSRAPSPPPTRPSSTAATRRRWRHRWRRSGPPTPRRTSPAA